MKIIGVSNQNYDNVSDILVAENIQSKLLAECMVKALNDEFCKGDHSLTYYLIKPDNYTLFKFER